MDGVLLDSEPYYYEYLNRRFEKLGLSVTDEEYNGFVGLPSRKVWSYLEDSRGIDLEIEELMQTEEEEINKIFNQAKLKPIDGVSTLLERLHSNKFPMSIASSSYKSTIELIVGKLSFNHYFRFLTSGTEVNNGKPHPDIFLKAVQLHELKPENCLVIEDSRNGLIGAKKAGTLCVGFINTSSGNQDLSEADLIIEDFSENNIESIFKLMEV